MTMDRGAHDDNHSTNPQRERRAGRRRPVLVTVALAAVITLVAALVAAQPATAAGTFTAKFTSQGDWGNGHQVGVTVTNSGRPP